MIHNVYIITLTLSDDEELLKTFFSAQEMAASNTSINFKHIVISPNDCNILKEQATTCSISNYRVAFMRDEKLGIYHAFNMGLNAISGDGYAIFLSSGDSFKKEFRFLPLDFTGDNQIIAYAVEIRRKNNSVIYKPKLSHLPFNTIPHPGCLTKISTLKKLGSFPTDLGTSSDFYVTQNIINKKMKILLRTEPITDFHLGGVSSKFSSIKDYKNSLKRLGYGKLIISLCCAIKVWSYLKYAE